MICRVRIIGCSRGRSQTNRCRRWQFQIYYRGQDIAVRRARTRLATVRHAALRNAADTLKELAEMDNDVEIVWGRDGEQRGVKVKGTYAFTQPSGDSLSNFSCDFEYLDL